MGPTAIASATPVSCNGGTNGAVTLVVNGGTPAYSYSWSNGSVTQNLTGVAAGTYTVTVTDANGCTITTSATVTQPLAPLALSTTQVNTTCGNSNGSIDLTVVGGTAGYTYNWSNGAVTQDLSALLAGGYSVTVTDANGCTATISVTITTSSAPIIVVSPDQVICEGQSVVLSASGAGVGGTYSWTPSATLSSSTGTPVTATPLITTTYTVTGIDANGCFGTATITVIVNPLPTTSPIFHD